MHPSPEPLKRHRSIRQSWTRVVGAAGNMVHRRTSMISTSISSLGKQLQQAVSQDWSSRHYSRYREVHGLLTYWAESEEDNFYAAEAANKLRNTFRGKYGFNAEVFIIPILDQPQQFLASRLARFVRDHGHKGNLLIFWYGGFTEALRDGTGPVLWHGERWAGRVNSGIVPQILGTAKADILTLYDCGNSLHGQSVSGGGTYEHLGASSSSAVPGFRSPGNFTKLLIRVLEKNENVAYGISVVDIHRKLVNLSRPYREDVNPEGDKRSSIYSQETIRAPTWFHDSFGGCPVYCHLSACPPRSAGKPSTIILSHLGYPLELFSYMSQGDELEVQLRLTMRNNNLDVERWNSWILQAPALVENVSVEVAQANNDS